ncbi:hypothetical protein EW145_g3677 [Phellinidium pouzarii]|uniref:Cellobiose dehydrogenase-like cytochrome domain-containing protein n=1 Tax=Phellinidium pouzarii TaxID=167371 RepID=A0A4S4LBI1_9AGAM|nr:hypothetical protein EW145_g3677 [Phellinidium pouzarii]
MFSLALLSSAALAIGAYAQSSVPLTDTSTGMAITYQAYSDPFWNITIGFSLPEPNSFPNEFIGLISFPESYSYAGISLGSEGMVYGLLLGAWSTGEGVPGIVSPRYTTEYVYPDVFFGPQISVIRTSTTNATRTTLNFRCQNCTSWTDGSLDPTSTSAFMSFAVATEAASVIDPTDVASDLLPHNPNDINFFTVDLASAQSSDYTNIINFLNNNHLLNNVEEL